MNLPIKRILLPMTMVLLGIGPLSLAAVPSEDTVRFADRIKFKVEKFVLDNGLTVLVAPDHSMPIISYQQWFRVGSSRENPGRTGLAHFFEHLMFKGTKKYPEGVIDRIIQMNGGSNNAFTTEDYTGYYTNLPSDKLELIIDVESDRMRNLQFEQKEIDSEREVVKEERRMRFENSVMGSLFERLRETIYKTSPYHWPVIGYTPDLNAAKLEEFKEFYDKFYAPNNAVVVVAGDVTVGQVRKLIEKYYGSISRQELPAFNPTPEAEQKSPRYAKIEKDVQSSTVAVSYRSVKAGDTDTYALDLLSSALGAGSSSRLYKRLVYQNRLATSVNVFNDANKLSGNFTVIVALNPGASLAKVKGLIGSELEKLKREPLSADELKKLKNQVMLDYVQGLQTAASKARTLASNEVVFGDYNVLFDDIDKYNAVTPEDIMRVANKYILPTQRSTVEVVPKTKGVL